MTTQTLTIYGASDDLIEIELNGKVIDEFDAVHQWAGRVVAPDGDSLVVRGEYGARGRYRSEWTLTVQSTTTWPDWPIRFTNRPDSDGDPALEIEVPEGTQVEEVR